MASANDDKDKESSGGSVTTTTTTSNAASQIPRATSSFIDNNSVCLNANTPNQTNLFAPDKPDKEGSADAKSNSANLPGNNSYAKFDRKYWLSPSNEDLEVLCGHLKEKLEKGHGEAYISIGSDSGTGFTREEVDLALKTIEKIERQMTVSMTKLKEQTIEPPKSAVKIMSDDHHQQSTTKYILDIILRRNYDEVEDFIEVRVAVVGNVDAGKSTLLGVLTHGVLDDGRGEARTKLFRHKHEIESGRTSSVGNDILGFNSHGVEINEWKKASGMSTAVNKAMDWEEICKQSSKVITFIDLAGHEKYLKTTVFGMTGHCPDYAMLMIGSNMGIIGMTKEHLGLSLALNIPVFVVITKIDMCPPNVLQETLKTLLKILKSPGCRKIAYLVENKNDVVTCANNFTSERLCPIFQVSNVTGQNLDLLKGFLNLLNSRMESNINDPAEFQIDDIYSVPGVGTVVSGTCFKGRIQVNDTLLLGPDLIGQFRPIVIKGIHRKRLPVKECRGGQTASFAVKKLKRSDIRKGMYLIHEKLNPMASWVFEAEVLILHHPTTISVNYQAMVHCGSIRQTATIIRMNVEHMRTGDKALVIFAFIKNPEFLRPGTKMVFREGRTKAIGTITRINLKKEEPAATASTTSTSN